MHLVGWFRRVLGRASVAGVAPSIPPAACRTPLPIEREQAAAWLAACEAGDLCPPADVHDRHAWDQYWSNQLRFGAMEQGLADSMASDDTLVGLLRRRSSRTILCVGDGLSGEAAALAVHGFDVTALDLSAVPGEVFNEQVVGDPEHRVHQIPGFTARADGVVSFGPPDLIDPELCPPMHRSEDQPPRGGGSLSFVTGDLMNADLCPGPFDVVIERRTVQLFPVGEREAALERLVARLGGRGLFVSHEHQGAWTPGQSRTHFAEQWVKRHGFVLRSGWRSPEPECESRLAWLTFSSG